ncbi:MFS transporter [Cordyceps militaris]|uniref:MFS transporter n=1 Tax=Cordyceps militaris TaxID=73501 RepID=A0A2H4SQH6_CORMI|nr:MFS transporter [Cordyceps militaris]
MSRGMAGNNVEKQPPPPPQSKPGPVSWLSLPRKDQLLILFLCRLVDFLQVASMQAYVFYQLKHMDDSLSDASIAKQAGLLQACFTGTQVMTAMLWGKAADAPWCGRKSVVAIGLAGTAVSCLGYGFSTTFFWAAFWRAFGGAVNGTVGVIRTMLSEIIKEKKYQSRAFLILPMSFNVAGILGPFFGGMLASAGTTLPGVFGTGALLGFRWVQKYPFALPSLMNVLALSLVTLIVMLFLEETSPSRRHLHDPSLAVGQRIAQRLFGNKPSTGYSRLTATESCALDDMSDQQADAPQPAPRRPPTIRRLPFSRLWTSNVIFTLITTAFYDFHLGAFGNIWSLFLSTPRYIDSAAASSAKRSLPLLFTGGLGMPAATVGIATSFLGIIGMGLQLTMYPSVHARLGTMRSFRWFLLLFPVCYFMVPYLSILPSTSDGTSDAAASGPLVWLGILWVLLLAVAARTFTLPTSIILLNNCSPHPSVLGTIHGLGQSVSAGFRTVGPVVGGWWYGYGLDIGMVAWGWWSVALVSAVGCLTALGMYEGSGHEVRLEGEDEEE